MNLINPVLSDTLSTGWHGKLDLVYAHHHSTTGLIHSQSQAPLKVQRPFYPEGPAVCHTVVLHTAGGIVGGDQLSFSIGLKPNAKALITTAAASKVYRSNGLIARQILHIEVCPGAFLEWLPQETIVFNGAIYQQNLRVELAPQASWLAWELTRFGRSARGEQFLQGNWRSYTEVWQQGRPLWIDRQHLEGGEEMLKSPHGLAGYPVVGSLVWVGSAVSPELVEQVRTLWSTKESTKGTAGVTRLLEGLLCRYRGPSTLEARSWFIDVWKLLRLSYLGQPACLPRVWP